LVNACNKFAGKQTNLLVVTTLKRDHGVKSMRHSRSDPSSRAPTFRALVAEAARIVGSQAALAAELGKSQQLVSFLCTHATEISAEDAIGIHRVTGGKVPASALRPDLWRRPKDVPVEECAT